MRELIRKFQTLKIKNKFILVYVTLLIIPLMIMSIFTYNNSSLIMESQSEKIMQHTLIQSEMYLDYMFKEISSLAFYVQKDMEQLNLVRETQPNYNRYNFRSEIDRIMSLFFINTNYERYELYIKDESLVPTASSVVFPYESIHDPYLIEKINKTHNKAIWSTKDMNNGSATSSAFVYTFLVGSPYDYKDNIGVMCIYFNRDYIQSVLDNMQMFPSGFSMIVNENQEILLKSSNAPEDISGFATYIKNGDSSSTSRAKNDTISLSIEIGETGWSLTYCAPRKEVLKDINNTVSVNTAFTLLCVVLAVLGAVLISNQITAGVNRLISYMKNVSLFISQKDSGKPVLEESEYMDEIAELDHSFHAMVARLKKLNEDNMRIESEKRVAQLKALQIQINPHFLYNVLDSINWMAARVKAYDIVDIVGQLGSFYRIALSGGEDIITLEKELEHTRLYLEIQKLRFKDKIQVEMNVDENLLNCEICKISLQPLIENAIVHGIFTKPDKQGVIIISCYRLEDLCVIKIRDDAGAMNPEEVKEMMKERIYSKDTKSGYGIHNVNERIRLYFGEQYGLDFKLVNGWSVSVVKLPIRLKSDEATNL